MLTINPNLFCKMIWIIKILDILDTIIGDDVLMKTEIEQEVDGKALDKDSEDDSR